MKVGLDMRDKALHQEEAGFLQGVKDCLPTLLGYLSIGFAAGVVQKAAGLSAAEIALMSLILYAGSAQFITTGMLAAGSTSATIILTILFVNLRHLLLSAALSPYFRHLGPFRNLFIGALLTDETFGVAINEAAKRNRLSERWMHGLNLAAYANWFVANMAGAFLGHWITDHEKLGLDYALTAMFIGLLVLAMAGRKGLKRDTAIAVLSGAVAVASAWFISGSLGVILATIVASTVGMAVEKWK